MHAIIDSYKNCPQQPEEGETVMAGSLNRCTLIGYLGKDPEAKNVGDGNLVTFSMAMTDAWTSPTTGERQEKTEWANIAIWNAALGEVAMDFLKKGSRAFVEGRLETRSWEKDGQKHYATEVVIRPYNGQLILLDKPDRPAPTQRRDRGAEPRR
jgi:single-strand DNA-binding protein